MARLGVSQRPRKGEGKGSKGFSMQSMPSGQSMQWQQALPDGNSASVYLIADAGTLGDGDGCMGQNQARNQTERVEFMFFHLPGKTCWRPIQMTVAFLFILGKCRPIPFVNCLRVAV